MRPRASGVSICPSGVRRKIASGAGQLPRSWTTFVHSLASAAASASVTFERSIALRDPVVARSSSSRTSARSRKRNASRSCVSSTPSWRTTSSRGPDAVEHELAQRVAVERREEQVAHADEELDDLDVGLARRRRGGLVVLDEERADEAAAEVGERQPLRLERLVGSPDADDEVDEREVGVSAVDGERRDARARR